MTLKLTKTQVNVGGLQVEGMTDGEGNFYVSAVQVHEQFSWSRPDNVTRDLKRLHGEGFGLVQDHATRTLKRLHGKDFGLAHITPVYKTYAGVYSWELRRKRSQNHQHS